MWRADRAPVLHWSASATGNAAVIDDWHRERGFRCVVGGKVYHIGYHYVVLPDGTVETGRPESRMGAHCKARGMNVHSLGICLIGPYPGYPAVPQRDAALRLLARLCREYGQDPEGISQHSDWEPQKPECASLNLGDVRRRVKALLAGEVGIYVAGEEVCFGEVKGGRIYAPVRPVAEALGYLVTWDGPTKIAVLSGPRGQHVLDCLLVDGRAVYPVRMLAALAGVKLLYDAAGGRVLLSG